MLPLPLIDVLKKNIIETIFVKEKETRKNREGCLVTRAVINKDKTVVLTGD